MREGRTFTDASRRMAGALTEEYDARRRDDEQTAWGEYAARVRGVSADSWRSGAGSSVRRRWVEDEPRFPPPPRGPMPWWGVALWAAIVAGAVGFYGWLGFALIRLFI